MTKSVKKVCYSKEHIFHLQRTQSTHNNRTSIKQILFKQESKGFNKFYMCENGRITYKDIIWKMSLRDEENAIKKWKKSFLFYVFKCRK